MTNDTPRRRGRPALGEDKLITRNVSMSATQWEAARRLGDGCYAAGLRAAIDAATKGKK